MALTAIREVPHLLRACASSGECVVHDNGIYGVDDVRLAEMIILARAERRTLRRAFRRMHMHGWVVV